MVLRRLLHGMVFRYRLHAKNLPGKPDWVFPKCRAVIFVHGCFWHRHMGCRYATKPANLACQNSGRVAGTVERDRRAVENLTKDAWRVAVVWECELKQGRDVEVANQVAAWLTSDQGFIEIPESPPEPMR